MSTDQFWGHHSARAIEGKRDYWKDDSRRSRGGVVGTSGKPVICFRVDHGIDQWLSTFWPMFEARALPASVGVVTRPIDNPDDPYEPTNTTWAELLAAQRRGFEVWCHSHTHLDPLVVGTTLAEEVVDTKAIIESNGMRVMGTHAWGVPGCTYPHVSNNFVNPASWESDYGQLLREHYGLLEIAGAVGGAYRALPTHGADDLGHVTLDNLTLAQAKNVIDECVRLNISSQIMFHPKFVASGTYTFQTADMDDLLDYVVTKRDAGLIEVLTSSAFAWADPTTSHRLNLVGDPSFAANVAPTSSTAPGWYRGGNLGGSMSIGSDGGRTGSHYLITPSGVGFGYAQNDNGRIWALNVHGTTMVAEAWVRARNGDCEARMTVVDQTATTLNLERYWPITSGGDWQLIRSVFTVPPSATAVGLRLMRRLGDGDIHWDDVGIYPV